MSSSDTPRPDRPHPQPVQEPVVTSGTGQPGPASGSGGRGTGDQAKDSGKQVAGDAKQSGKQVADDAKQSGQQVAQDAKEGGQQVAQTAAEEAQQVASSVADQARSLLDETTSQLSDQAGTQQHRLAGGLRSLADELGSMAEGSEQSGPATGLVREASERTQGLAGWLEDHEPGDLLEEVKRFARRRPGTFVAVAAGVGLLAGRLTRGLTDDESADASGRSGAARVPATTGPYGGAGVPPVPATPPPAPATAPPSPVAPPPPGGPAAGGPAPGVPPVPGANPVSTEVPDTAGVPAPPPTAPGVVPEPGVPAPPEVRPTLSEAQAEVDRRDQRGEPGRIADDGSSGQGPGRESR